MLTALTTAALTTTASAISTSAVASPTISTAMLPGHPVAGPWTAGWGWVFVLIPLLWIAFFALLFFVIGRRWRRAAWAGDGSYGPPWARAASAEQTLAERFAKGDIDEVEYRARLEVLRANRPNP